MAINLDEPAVPIREARLSTITGYDGDSCNLAKESRNCTIKNRTRSFSQCGSCSADQVMNLLLQLQDAAVVEHGPAGCSGDIPFRNGNFRLGNKRLGLPVHNVKYINTNLGENDTIFGGRDKLERAVREAYHRFNPRAIFVTTTCASAIIGDDVNGICENLEKELNIPVVATICEGFRTNVWASGFDAANHAILRKIVKPPRKKQPDLINVISFTHRYHYESVFTQMGLRPNYIVPFSTIEQLEYISEAAATVQYCETLGSYLAAGLEEKYGVPEVKAPPPFGIEASDNYLRTIGRMFHKENEAEKVIASEKEKITPRLEELRNALNGKKAFVGAGSPLGYSISALLKDLGIETVGASIWHHDQKFDNDHPDLDVLSFNNKHIPSFPVGVCNKQSFEVVNALHHYKPDIFISRHMATVWAAKIGIPAFLSGVEPSEMLYDGLIRYGEIILNTVTNPAFVKNVAKHSRLPYTDWWLNQKSYAFLNEEESE